MKNYLIIIALAITTSCAFAQTAIVKLSVHGAKSAVVKVLLPFEGIMFYGNVLNKQLDKDSSLTVRFPVEKIAKLSVTINDRNFMFYIEPGQTNIGLNLNKKGASAIDFDGQNMSGQLLINQQKNVFYQDKADQYYRSDTTAIGISALIKADEQKELRPFNDLLESKKITPAFYQLIKNEISFNYAAITAHVPIGIYFDSGRANSKVVFKKEFKDLWAQTYEERPVNDVAGLSTTNFYDYASYYSKYYKNYYLGTLNGTFQIPKVYDENENLKIGYQCFANSFSGRVKESLLASFVYNELQLKKFQPALVDLYHRFASEFPNSKFLPLLKVGADEVTDYHQKIKNEFKGDQKFITGYDKISSLEELIAVFKGKTVFVDIWATWCAPCKEEFQYNKRLDEYLKASGVEMLFISMDKDRADQQWKDMIKFYNLSGHHIRTNEQLQKDMINKLWNGKGYSIPRYLIIKDGKIVEPKALQPSEKEELYKQIGKYI